MINKSHVFGLKWLQQSLRTMETNLRCAEITQLMSLLRSLTVTTPTLRLIIMLSFLHTHLDHMKKSGKSEPCHL